MSFATKPSDRLVEWLFAAMMLFWGLYLLLPMRTFDLPQYALLRAIADEQVWAAFSIGIGGMRMAALVVNGQMRQTPLVRALGAGLGVIWWLVMTYLFFTAPLEAPPAGVVWYPLFVLFEGYSLLRSGADTFVAGTFRRSSHAAR